MIFRPLAKGYEFITPSFVRKGVSNFFENLFYPNTIINQFLQGNAKLGLQDTGRFLLNTTIGLAGFIDVASETGLSKHNEDFGQTFGVWGIGNGPYIVVPIWGPATIRDGIGNVAGLYTNPLSYIEDDEFRYTMFGASLINARYKLFKAEALVSGDRYTFIRDAYLQKREFMVKNGKIEESDPFLDEE